MSELRSSERASHEAPKLAWLLAKVPQPTSMDRNAFLPFVATERGFVVACRLGGGVLLSLDVGVCGVGVVFDF